ncbi:MAG: serine O-acetyltransferase EpsC [Lentisphaeria bacterium]
MSQRNDRRKRCARYIRKVSEESLWTSEYAQKITANITATYQDQQGINHISGLSMPQSEVVLETLDLLLEVLFPGYTGRHVFYQSGLEFAIGNHIEEIYRSLTEQIERAFAYRCKLESCEGCDCRQQAEEAVVGLLSAIPDIRSRLKTDVKAALDGDPAARSTDEVVISYPGLKTIAIHRVAHALYRVDVPLIPRVMSEYAHSMTGIDIHPGASIGDSFFIDHGTGVVVGETAVIGKNVKIYQGVTLGALSFPKDERGQLIKGTKRHPNIEDNVTIYSGATLLGDITIGHDSVIGGNVWITESIEPHSKITIASPELSIRTRKKKG